jgi:hypothetical protein
MLGRFFASSSYSFYRLANEATLVNCCNASKCTGMTRTGRFGNVIICWCLKYQCYLHSCQGIHVICCMGYCHTAVIWGPFEIPSCRSLSSMVVEWLMFLLLNSASVV